MIGPMPSPKLVVMIVATHPILRNAISEYLVGQKGVRTLFSVALLRSTRRAQRKSTAFPGA